MKLKLPLLAAMAAVCASAQYKAVNPTVKKIVDEVSEERVTAIMKKLESFETRNIFSPEDDPEHGVGAARRWIFQQLQSYSPRLQVRFDSYKVKKSGRIIQDVELHNVVAVLPGKTNPERQFIISGHYVTLATLRPPQPTGGGPPEPIQLSDLSPIAPGVSDDGSGTAAVMELARVMSQYEFEKTIV